MKNYFNLKKSKLLLLTLLTMLVLGARPAWAQKSLPYSYGFEDNNLACPVPTNLTATSVKLTSATLNWEGNAESYNLRYAIAPENVLFEDFENGLNQWTVVRNGEGDGITDWHVVNSNTVFGNAAIPAHSGNYVVMTRSYNGSGVNVDNWLISPQVNLGGTMTYWVRDDGQFHEHYDIYVSTTTTDLSAFTKVYEPGNASGEWTEVTVDLSAYAGQQGYVAFRNTDNDQDFLFIDDVTITAPSSTIDWTTVNNVTSPYTITGLSPETKYNVEVQAVYEGGESTWAPTSFTTFALDAAPFDLQTADVTATTATLNWEGVQDNYNVRYRKLFFFDDFENGLGNWTTYTMGNAPAWGTGNPISSLSGHNSSTNVAFSMSWNNNVSYTADNWLVTPQVQLGGTLKFYVYTNQSYPDAYEVKLSTGGNTIDDFTVTLQEMASIPTTGDWVEVNIDLSSYEGQSGYIAIHHSFYDGNYIFVDDFGIYGECIEATSTTNSLDITGLTPGTTYEFQVQGVYGEDGESNWSASATFTTGLEVTLTDGQAITDLNDYKEQEIWVNYTRSFTAGTTSTVCLPFAYTKKEGDGSFYAFTNIEKVGSEYVATMTEPAATTLEANTPYLYLPNATGDVDFGGAYTIPAELTAGETTSNGWTFKGTFTTIEWTTAPTGTYGFSAQTQDGISQGQFVQVGDYVKIKPMRCYLENESFAGARGMNRAAEQLPETIKVRLIGANGEVNAIGTISTKTGEGTIDSDAWYTLDGRRVMNPAKGMYVKNGQKVVIK